MPIRPEMRARYPEDWKALSLRIRTERAQGRCECRGECGTPHGWRCDALNGQPHPDTGSRVVLTVAHLNHLPEDCRDENLRALCQRCHLRLDGSEHARNAAATRRRKLQNQEFFEEPRNNCAPLAGTNEARNTQKGTNVTKEKLRRSENECKHEVGVR